MTRLSWLHWLLALLALSALTWLAIAQLAPPPAQPEDAAPTEFSAGRALRHLQHIARAPHSVGSVEHEAVRDYILAELGRLHLTPTVQVALGAQHETEAQLTLCDVQNIVVRLPGKGGLAGALLLVAHYDSVQTGPGASDDGHGVAVLLETLRALQARAPLARDVLVLFSDAEEIGLLGAKAFVRAHPDAHDIALALNFEARGTRGPAFLFETVGSAGGELARELARATPFPRASSLIQEVYRRLPNDTDLTVLGEAGMRGLNFGFFDNYIGYHAQSDDVANLDPASVQHQGSYALSLATHFGQHELVPERKHASTWFNMSSRWLVWYPSSLDQVLLGVSTLGFAYLVISGRRRQRWRLRGLGIGLAGFASTLLVWPLLMDQAWRGFSGGVGLSMSKGYPQHANFYALAILLLTVAVMLTVARLGLRWAHPAELALGALAGEVALALGISWWLPGGAYLIGWPLLLSVVTWCLWLVRSRSTLVAPPIFPLAVAVAAAVWLLTPWIYLLFALIGLEQVAVTLAVLAVLGGFLAPLLGMAAINLNWRVPTGIAMTACGLVTVGSLTAQATPAHPDFNSVAYALDADSNQAHWIAEHPPEDPWTLQLIPDSGNRRSLDGFFPFTDWTFYQGPAPAAPLAPPRLLVFDNYVADGVRHLGFQVYPAGPAESTLVYLASDPSVKAVEVKGHRFDQQRTSASARWALRYFCAACDGFAMKLETDPSVPVALRVVAQYVGLDRAVAPRRPAHLAQNPFGFGPQDQSYVGRTFADLEKSAPQPPRDLDRQ